MQTAEAVSPTITSLEAGDASQLEAFWRRIEESGAPLVEPISDAPGESLLTFVWRDTDGETRDVRIAGAGVAKPAGEALQRLGETDLWHRTFRVRSDLRGRYRMYLNAPDVGDESVADLIDVWKSGRADPLNPKLSVTAPFDFDPESFEERVSIVELPDAPPQPWYEARPGVPAGTVEEITGVSELIGDERPVWVYSPPSPGGPTDLAVLLDGEMWALAMPLAPTFDNLIAEGCIPPTTVVMVPSVDQARRWRDMEFSEEFNGFLADELLPLVRGRWQATGDPARTVIAGQSLGGLAAAFAGLERPDVFGNVLSQAGAFYWKSETYWLDDDDPGEERIKHMYSAAPKLPLRFYIDVGMLEGRKMLEGNRRFRDVLLDKGYDVTYREFYGGHEYVCWRGTMADGLIALMGT